MTTSLRSQNADENKVNECSLKSKLRLWKAWINVQFGGWGQEKTQPSNCWVSQMRLSLSVCWAGAGLTTIKCKTLYKAREWEICHLLPHWVLTVPEQKEHAYPDLSVSLCCFSTSNIRTLEIPKVLLEDFGSHPSKIMKLLWNMLGRHLIELYYFCVWFEQLQNKVSPSYLHTFFFLAVRGHWWGEKEGSKDW